jgi:hypothetical protein
MIIYGKPYTAKLCGKTCATTKMAKMEWLTTSRRKGTTYSFLMYRFLITTACANVPMQDLDVSLPLPPSNHRQF